jgi:hypothetical protein
MAWQLPFVVFLSLVSQVLFTKIIRNNTLTTMTTQLSVAMALSTDQNNDQQTKRTNKRGDGVEAMGMATAMATVTATAMVTTMANGGQILPLPLENIQGNVLILLILHCSREMPWKMLFAIGWTLPVAAKTLLCVFAWLNNSIQLCVWGVVMACVCLIGFNMIVIMSPLYPSNNNTLQAMMLCSMMRCTNACWSSLPSTIKHLILGLERHFLLSGTAPTFSHARMFWAWENLLKCQPNNQPFF